ncbi:MAG: YitT family protein [Clostridia bacterium]|nr:YitT family protein [Clostridia bacterium]
MVKEELRSRFKLPHRSPLGWITRFGGLILLCALTAIVYYVFIIPNNFAPGGLYGIGSMIESKTGFPMGFVVILISIPVLILAFIFLDLDHTLVVLTLTVSTSLFEVILGKTDCIQYIADNGDKVTKIFAAIIGGTLGGFVFGTTIKKYGVMDGTLTIASIIQKKNPHMSVAWLSFAMDVVVIASSFIVFWPEYTAGYEDASLSVKFVHALDPIMYSVINVFMSTTVCDRILKGMRTAYRVEIVTEQADDFCRDIIKKLNRGVTVSKATGAYSGRDKSVLMTVISKKQIGTFERIAKKYPSSFVLISTTNEIIGYFTK